VAVAPSGGHQRLQQQAVGHWVLEHGEDSVAERSDGVGDR
jgi:hypothetical protein